MKKEQTRMNLLHSTDADSFFRHITSRISWMGQARLLLAMPGWDSGFNTSRENCHGRRYHLGMTGKCGVTFIKLCLLGRGQNLGNPLGLWLHPTPEWSWYFSPTEDCLYYKENDDSWKGHNRIPTRST